MTDSLRSNAVSANLRTVNSVAMQPKPQMNFKFSVVRSNLHPDRRDGGGMLAILVCALLGRTIRWY
jgi:hypothetical protein